MDLASPAVSGTSVYANGLIYSNVSFLESIHDTTDTKTANAPVVFRSAFISYFVLRDHKPLHCEYEEEQASE